MTPRSPLLSCFALLASVATAAETGPSPERFADYFRPDQTTKAALSPDGRYVAYSVHKGESLYLQILDLENPGIHQDVAVADDYWEPEYSNSRMPTGRDEKNVAAADMLRWMTARRVVFSSNEGRVFAIDADGKNPQILATPRDVAQTTGNRERLRRPRVIDVHDWKPGKLLIDGSGGGEVELFQVDYTKGGEPDSFDIMRGRRISDRDFLFDQQGNLRLQFYGNDRPQYYEHTPASGGRPRDLDSFIDKSTGLSFHTTVANYLGSRSIPLGFGYDPNILYYTSNVGRDTFGVYALDLTTGKPTDFKVEHPLFDLADADRTYNQGILVLDRARRAVVGVRFTGIKPATWWVDPELRQMQMALDKKFPTKVVQIIDWDDVRDKYLITLSSAADPGSWLIFAPKAGRLSEFAKRAPWIDDEKRNPSGAFEFTSPGGVHISGFLTVPRKPRIGRAPMVVYCRESAWDRQAARFYPEVQALAAMGYAVLQVNHRGTDGFGTKFRLAARQAFDRVPAEDIVAAIDWACAKQNINPKLVGIYGNGWGGYFALRTMELYPDRFRCGIVVNPQVDLNMLLNYLSAEGHRMRDDVYRDLFGKDSKQIDDISVTTHADKLVQPVLVVQNSERSVPQSDALRRAMSRNGHKPEVLGVSDEFQRGPKETASAYAQIEGFLNLNVYRFKVETGETKVVHEPDAPVAPDDPIPEEIRRPKVK
jgi:dienelactone hydrolase